MLHAVSVEVMGAVSCPAVIKVVVLGVMPQYMTEPDVKLLPLTIKVNAEPAVALFGVRLVMVGAAPPPMELDGFV